MARLERSFYARPAVDVSRDLLGKVLARRTSDTVLNGRIVEVEAYTGSNDPGSHAFRGQTFRNRVMFGEPGHVYVYRIYGYHFCMNVVAESAGVAGAALIRALEPLEGIEVMTENRQRQSLLDLCSGPAKLCQALGITIADNGADLEGDDIWIEDDDYSINGIGASTRVGLTRGAELPLRYFLPDSRFVSRGKPSMPAGV